MAIVILRNLFASSPWRRAFADALIRLRPDMNPDAADEASDTAYGAMSELPPVDAAQAFASGGITQPPSDSEGKSGQAT